MGKKKEKPKSSQPSQRWKYFEGDKRVKKVCPNCGPGIYMGEHKNPNRYHCGKCSYTENIE